ncbi:MAG TPA: hypothetical protein VF678_15445, partial [bacterium]
MAKIMGAGMVGMRAALALSLVAAVAAAGCSFGRSTPATSPRAQVQDASGGRDLAALRQENEALKQEQLQSARQIEALQKQLSAQQEEQKRFREMMTTNFDLLEQSVALTLSKSIDNTKPQAPAAAAAPVASKPAVTPAKAPVAAPTAVKSTADEMSAPAEMPESAKPAPSESAAPKLVGQSSTPPLIAGSMSAKPQMLPTASKPAVTSAGPAKEAPKAVVPVAAVTKPQPAFNDPDLTPPTKPKNLTANRAAKALYERGFALYANRQYDQAVL